MIILAVDTTNADCGVAVMRGDAVCYEIIVRAGRQHGAQLVPMIEAALDACGVAPADVGLWAAAVGPGSFTGVRIGVSAIRGYAHALGAPCAGVNALEALAQNAGDACAVPMFDARRGQVYAAAFAGGERILPDAALPADDMLAAVLRAAAAPMPIVLLGEGAVANAASLACGRAHLAPPHQHAVRPAAVARMARHAPPLPPERLEPYYLRPPQAEQARRQREDRPAREEGAADV